MPVNTPAPASHTPTPEPATPTPTEYVLPVDLLASGDDDHTEPFEICLDTYCLDTVLDALREGLYIRRPTPTTPTPDAVPEDACPTCGHPRPATTHTAPA